MKTLTFNAERSLAVYTVVVVQVVKLYLKVTR
jgi:hypothetical protein